MKRVGIAIGLLLMLTACKGELDESNNDVAPYNGEGEQQIDDTEESEQTYSKDESASDKAQQIDDEETKQLYELAIQYTNDMSSWTSVKTNYIEIVEFESDEWNDSFKHIYRELIAEPKQAYTNYSYYSDFKDEQYERYNTEETAYIKEEDGNWYETVSLHQDYAFYIPAIQEMIMNLLLSMKEVDYDYREDALTMLMLTFDESQWEELFEMVQYGIDLHVTEAEILEIYADLLRNLGEVHRFDIIVLINELYNQIGGYRMEIEYSEYESDEVDFLTYEEVFYAINEPFEIVIPE